jgi:hypothetical protein
VFLDVTTKYSSWKPRLASNGLIITPTGLSLVLKCSLGEIWSFQLLDSVKHIGHQLVVLVDYNFVLLMHNLSINGWIKRIYITYDPATDRIKF